MQQLNGFQVSPQFASGVYFAPILHLFIKATREIISIRYHLRLSPTSELFVCSKHTYADLMLCQGYASVAGLDAIKSFRNQE